MSKLSKPYVMTSQMKDVLIGNLLGDGCLTENQGKKRSTARFTHAQTSENKEFKCYNYHIYTVMKPITLAEKPAIRLVKTDGKDYTQSVFNTSFYPELYNDFFTFFYKPNPDLDHLKNQGKSKINKYI